MKSFICFGLDIVERRLSANLNEDVELMFAKCENELTSFTVILQDPNMDDNYIK